MKPAAGHICITANHVPSAVSAVKPSYMYAGTADVESAGSVQHAVARRDAEIRAYFDAEVVRLLLVPEQQERTLHLTREMCALKLAQQQLIASHAAAKRRGDAVALQAVGLKTALQARMP